MRIRLPNKTVLLCLVCLSAAALSGCANLAPAACDAPASGAANCAPAVATSYSRMYETPILTPLQRYEVPALPVKRVLIRPKATQLTVTFMRPHSLAKVCVNPAMPAFAAA